MWLVGEYQHEHRQFSELVQPQILIKSMKHAEKQLENDTNEVFSFTVAALVVAPLNCCKLQEADMRCQTENGNADHRTTLATANTQPVRSPASTPSDSKSSVSDGDLNKFVQNEFKLFQKFE